MIFSISLPWAVALCSGSRRCLRWPELFVGPKVVLEMRNSPRASSSALHRSCSSWCFPSLFYSCGGRRKASEKDRNETGPVRSRHREMKEHRSARLYRSSPQPAPCQGFLGDCPLLSTLHCGAITGPPLQLLFTPLCSKRDVQVFPACWEKFVLV